MSTSETYFQRGFQLPVAERGRILQGYKSPVVEWLRHHGFVLAVGDLTMRLAQEFGFCYGVDRAVEYAYEARRRFPDRRIFLTGEIIHNPGVNARLEGMGIRFLAARPPERYGGLQAGDVVILPAFGVTTAEFDELRARDVVLVDTTCGSVLNVWKTVERNARDGFTSVIHGKYWHEETRATASRAGLSPGGKYLVVRDLDEAAIVCRMIEEGGEAAEFLRRFAPAATPGFEPRRDLDRIGCANQTTMLSSESLEIADRLRESVRRRVGDEALAAHFRSFDTICSATQDRQDAVERLVRDGADLMIVIGGYNSSNTGHLAEIAAAATTTFHIENSGCIRSADEIAHKPRGSKREAVARGWLPAGPLRVGITSGASTPDSEVGEVVERLLRFRGCPEATLEELRRFVPPEQPV